MSVSQEPTGHQTRTRTGRDRIPVLDGLRSLVVLVMIVHFSYATELPTWGHAVFLAVRSLAANGIDVFFVLSGFLITGILLDAKGSANYFSAFYARRTLRIFPVYFGFLFVYFLVLPSGWGTISALREGTTDQWYYWTYLVNVAYGLGWPLAANTAHLWSLAVEEQYYLLWPVVVYVCTARQLRAVGWTCLFIAPLSRLALFYLVPGQLAFYTFTPARLDALAMGGLFALSVRSQEPVDPPGRWLQWVAIGGILVMATAGVAPVWLQGGESIGLLQLAMLTVSPYVAAVIFWVTLTSSKPSRWHRWVGWWPLRRIGMYSYGIYVLHHPLAYILETTGLLRMPTAGVLAALGYLAVMIPLSVAVGAFSWHCFERPILSVRS